MSWKIHGSLGVAAVAALVTAALATVTVTPIDDKPANPPASQPAAGAPQGSAVSTDPSLSLDALNGLIDSQKYPEALQRITRMMSMAEFDKPELMALRAECQLQTHQTASAVATLQEAARMATAANNSVQASDAAAFATLIQKSAPRNIYTPLNSLDKTPIDILDRTKRKSAYQALLVDMIVVMQTKLRSATANGSLPPFLDIAHDVPALKGVEHNANGGTKQADQFAKDAVNAAAKVITTTLSDYDSRINQISTSADRMVNNSGGGMGATYNNTNNFHRQGLSAEDAQTLQNIENTCAKIPDAVTKLTKAFENPDPFLHLAARAQTTAQRAYNVRTKNYN